MSYFLNSAKPLADTGINTINTKASSSSWNFVFSSIDSDRDFTIFNHLGKFASTVLENLPGLVHSGEQFQLTYYFIKLIILKPHREAIKNR